MQRQIKNIYEKYWLDIGAVLLILFLFGGGLLLIKTSKGETRPIQITGEDSGGQPGAATETGVKAAETKLIDINTADASELDTLPGIGESTANKIIDYRDTNGPFASKEDIKNVSGIGDSKYNDFEASITVE